VDIDGAVDMASTLTVGGNVTINSTTLKLSGDFPQLLFEDTAGSDVDAYIVNNASGLFIGKTNSPSASNDIVSIDLSTGGVVFNEASNDADFRVESNGNTHALFVDAGNDAIGMGATSSPVNAASTEGLFYSIGGSLTVASNTETLQINRNSTGGNNRTNIGLYNNGTLRGTIGTLGGEDGIYFQSSGDVDNLQLRDGVSVFNDSSADVDFRVESNGNTHMLFVDAGNDAVGVGCSTVGNSTLEVRSTGVDGTFVNAIGFQYSGNASEANTISTSVSSNAALSGMKFNISDGGGSSGKTNVATFLRNQIIFNDDSNDQDFRVESNADANAFFVNGGDGVVSFGGMGTNTRSPSSVEPKFQANSLTRMDSSISLCCNSNDALASLLMFSKTRSGNLTGATVCQAGDAVGAITWNAADGTDIDHGIAAIDAVVESGIGTNDTPGAIRFYTNSGTTAASERVRITGSGSLLVNETTPTAMVNVTNNNQAASTLLALEDKGGTGAHTQISFSNTNGQVGTINTSGSATAYNTSSDYRLKENITDLTGATDRLKQLAPKRFNFLNDADTTVDGFIAHEVSSIVPEAITGEKDEVDDNGDPVYQGIDQSKLVPLLVATIQELEARIAALESK
jgi:hypothetical protein